MSIEGLTTIRSAFGPEETASRLEAALKAKGNAILARIDHAAAAEQAGLTLDPTLLLVFGNPRVGTALMQACQTAGIDLPMKALVWQDSSGQTWLSYNEPGWIAERHGVAAEVALDAGWDGESRRSRLQGGCGCRRRGSCGAQRPFLMGDPQYPRERRS